MVDREAASRKLELLYLQLSAERDSDELLELTEHQLTETHDTIRELITAGWHDGVYDPDALALADSYRQMYWDLLNARYRKLISSPTIPAHATAAEKEFCSILSNARADLDRSYGRTVD
jgi:DNA replication initiation complex subunit (GINS family)